MNDIIDVAEKLYYELNPNNKLDVPSSVYELVEKWNNERLLSNSDLNLYDWIKKNK